MLAVEVAALRAFPKKVVQLMKLGLLFSEKVMEGLKHYSLLSSLNFKFRISVSV